MLVRAVAASSDDDTSAILHIVEEAIVVAGFLNGDNMDPITLFFSILSQNPLAKNSPTAWEFGFLPWLILILYVTLVFVFGRLMGLSALGLAYVSGHFFSLNGFYSGLGLVVAMILGLVAVSVHLSSSDGPWWL